MSSATRLGKCILKIPSVSYTVFEKFPVNMPVLAHKRETLEACALVIPTFLSAIRLYRICKCLFNAHMVYIDPPSVCFGLNPPMGTHFLD